MQAFRRIREIAKYSGVVVEEVAPGPNVQSDADVLQWIRDNGSLVYHASATCEWSLPGFEGVGRVLTGARQALWAKPATLRPSLTRKLV